MPRKTLVHLHTSHTRNKLALQHILKSILLPLYHLLLLDQQIGQTNTAIGHRLQGLFHLLGLCSDLIVSNSTTAPQDEATSESPLPHHPGRLKKWQPTILPTTTARLVAFMPWSCFSPQSSLPSCLLPSLSRGIRWLYIRTRISSRTLPLLF